MATKIPIFSIFKQFLGLLSTVFYVKYIVLPKMLLFDEFIPLKNVEKNKMQTYSSSKF
jgi:hypothetical protein